jgi:RNA polymerase sigma factor (sigma-70 family)
MGTPTTSREALEDDLLVVRCQLGERDAFEELIDKWHAPLWRYARRLTDSDDAAAETVQDVWIRVLRGIGRLRDRERFRAWLFTIARRVVMDCLRVAYAQPDPTDVDLETIAEPDDARDLEEEIRVLHEELARLPVVEREVLVLFYLQELTLNELSDVLAVPVGTVKSRLFRARQLLRRTLTTKGIHR